MKNSSLWVALSGKRLQVIIIYFFDVLSACQQLNTSIPLLRREAGRTEGYHHTVYAREDKEKSKENRTSALPCLPCSLSPKASPVLAMSSFLVTWEKVEHGWMELPKSFTLSLAPVLEASFSSLLLALFRMSAFSLSFSLLFCDVLLVVELAFLVVFPRLNLNK